jgi:hypothetical protein
LLYDKRKSVLAEEKKENDISRMRYLDLTSKLNVDNLDKRMLILERRADMMEYDNSGSSYKDRFTIRVES